MIRHRGVIRRRKSSWRCWAPRRKDRGSDPAQFWRTLSELNIHIICANTRQAKGRVECANQTQQDRLVKELRPRAIDTIAVANAHASGFMADVQSSHKVQFTLKPIIS
ncbi:hypothetical protein AJ87_09610 [Rhizobium yanglingense]|nr:hypothetical protein AJ87_09610 [Rhizobium yanglingense]